MSDLLQFWLSLGGGLALLIVCGWLCMRHVEPKLTGRRGA